MPVYQYQCFNCNEICDKYFKMNENPDEIICKKCGGKAVKVISKSTFILKGTGWAADNYNKKE